MNFYSFYLSLILDLLIRCVSRNLLFLTLFFILIATKNQKILGFLEKLGDKIPFKIYENFYNDRKKIYKEFKDDKKGYIYAIVNKLNGKFYIGSTRSIVVRLYNYFNLSLLEAQKKRPISSAILKYGLVNFSFIILEVVDLNVHNLEDRETYWIKLLKPNIMLLKKQLEIIVYLIQKTLN